MQIAMYLTDHSERNLSLALLLLLYTETDPPQKDGVEALSRLPLAIVLAFVLILNEVFVLLIRYLEKWVHITLISFR